MKTHNGKRGPSHISPMSGTTLAAASLEEKDLPWKRFCKARTNKYKKKTPRNQNLLVALWPAILRFAAAWRP